MAEYIKREAAVNGLAEIIVKSDMPEDWNKGMSAAMSALFRIPAADVRPVVRGKWQFHMFTANSCGYECRVCHTTWDAPTNFCPNCGAEMRGEQDV